MSSNPRADEDRMLNPARILTAALRPGSGAQFAHLRRGGARLTALTPRPVVVAVLGVAPQLGVSTVAALLGQALHAVAPGRAAVLDADGVQKTQRLRLGAADGGDLRALLATPAAWRVRRTVDRFLAPHAVMPLLSAAVSQRGAALTLPEIQSALHVLRRRYPVVVADLPGSMSRDGVEWAVSLADHVVLVITEETPVVQTRQWLSGARAGRRTAGVSLVSSHRTGSRQGVDVVLPADPVLAGYARIRLGDLQLGTLAAVQDLAALVVAPLRDLMLTDVTGTYPDG